MATIQYSYCVGKNDGFQGLPVFKEVCIQVRKNRIILLLVLGVAAAVIALFVLHHHFQEERSFESMNFKYGKFWNQVPTNIRTPESSMLKNMFKMFLGTPGREPQTPLPAEVVTPKEGGKQEGVEKDELRVTWLGHSTCLIELDGKTILIDPMFSDRASPISFAGPKRFEIEPSISISDLPKIDIVLISHDHYDHLDHASIMELQHRVERFYVPLGVGDHLRRWGVEASQIIEHDWWQESQFGSIALIATPSQHFSGRGLGDRNKTLWASWTIIGAKQRVFFSGDSGYFQGFKEIGSKYGPFDITMLESGAYNAAWVDIHMMPEETVQAHVDLRGKLLLPIHWGKFSLSIHPWKEPVQRVLKRAEELSVRVATPRIGESFWPGRKQLWGEWWNLILDE
jgi:L-ascorbate metabolism protein UlaG (beta-lactamase superfamily)